MVEQRVTGACGARGRVRAAPALLGITAGLALLACSDGSSEQAASELPQVGVPAPAATPAAAPTTAPVAAPTPTPGVPATGAAGGPAPTPPVTPAPPAATPTPPAPPAATPVPPEQTPVPPTPPAVELDGDPVPSAGCGVASSPGGGDFSMMVDGTNRTYIVSVPSGYDANRPYRLIFTWHYLGGSASGIARGGYYGMESRSAGSAILVSPEGIDAGWSNSGGRDVAFATQMLDWMKSNYCVDEARVFSTGFSYGAIMSNTVGCALGDQFRAIAPIAGSGPRAFGGSSCTGQVAAWLAHGNGDGTVSFASGQGSRDHWVAANHCGASTTDLGDCVAYEGCDDGYPVHWCEFSGGHTQPRFAPDAIWAFFEQF